MSPTHFEGVIKSPASQLKLIRPTVLSGLLVIIASCTSQSVVAKEVTFKSCEWIISPSGFMSCHVAYGRKNTVAASPSPPADRKKTVAMCQWPSTRTMTTLLSQISKVEVSCDFDSSTLGVPVLDARTFEWAVNLTIINVKNAPFKSTLASDTFCHLPRGFKELTLSNTQLVDMDEIGLGGRDQDVGRSCESAENLEDLWLFDNDIKVIRKRGPFSRMKRLTVLAFVDNHLEGIEPEAFINLVNLEYVFFNNNSLTRLAANTFKGLTKLKSLELESNRLRLLVKGTFADLDSLEELLINKNELQRIDNETFVGMPLLKSLDMSNNNGVHIAAGAFDRLRSLEELKLNGNGMREMPSTGSLDGLHATLKKLHMTQNFISTIDASKLAPLAALQLLVMNSNRLTRLTSNTFQMLEKLQRLELKDNLIEVIEDNVFAMESTLKSLHLGGNRLTRIPTDLLKLTKLKELDLSNNLIDFIGERLEQDHVMTDLRILNLRGNRLQELNDKAFTSFLNSLTHLDLANNRINKVGNETFEGLMDLTHLSMENNGQLDLTRNIYQVIYGSNHDYKYRMLDIFLPLVSLSKLNLSGNGLTKFEYRWFPSKLTMLVLSNNSIEKVNPPIVRFPQLVMLTHLDLSRNAIASIEPGSFPLSIQTLRLEHNGISSLDRDTFKLMTRLQYVSLEGNRLRTLMVLNTYVNSTYFVRFALKGNPFVCDCSLDWIHADYKGARFEIVDYRQLTCERTFKRQDDSTSAGAIATTASEFFLCSFDVADLPSRSCLMMSKSLLSCTYACPQQCRCYTNVARTWIMLDCLKPGNLALFPSDLPLKTAVLYLDGNDLSQLNDGELKWLSSLRRLYLNHNVIESVASKSFASLQLLEVLHLDHNALQRLPSNDDDHDALFANLNNLLALDLSHNRLSNLSGRLFEPLTKLRSLKLNDNLLVDYPVWTSLQSLVALSDVALQANPWSCDCEYALSYRQWIRHFTGKLVDKHNLYCVEDGHALASLIVFNVSDCHEGMAANGTIGGGVGEAVTVLVYVSPSWHSKLWVVIFPTTLVLAAVLVFVYRREVQVLVYSHYGTRLFHADEEKYDADKAYDAFVSYSTLDEDFVVDQLLPGLEQIEQPFSLCLHHRDFPIGAFINESIFDAIATSRRSILVLSKNFVQSEWCRFEFRTAHSQMLADRCKRVIVILLGDLPDHLDAEMKLYLRTNTYLAWGDVLFWKKLFFALPDRQPSPPPPPPTIID